MPDFNPGAATMRVATVKTPGCIPDAADFVDHEFISETLANEQAGVERESITNAAQKPVPEPGKFQTDGEVEVELNAEQHPHYLANIQTKITTTSPATDVYEHRLGVTEDDDFPVSLCVQVNRDDGMPQSFRDGSVNEATITLEEGGLLKANFALIFTRGDYFDDPTQVEDGATPNSSPQLRGIPNYTNWNLADGDIYIKATSAHAAGTYSAVAKIGAAATYGVADFDVLTGLDANGNPRWVNVVNSNGGAEIGTRANPVQITHLVGTGVEIDDEFRFNRERGEWVPAYADVPIFNEVNAFLYVDGAEICIEEFELSISRPVTRKRCIGGFFTRKILRRGAREVTLTLGRQYDDTFFRKKLEGAQSIYFLLEARSGEEFETGFEHGMDIFCPNVKLTGRPATVESSDEFPEQITGTCHASAAGVLGFFDDVTVTFINSIPDLTA